MDVNVKKVNEINKQFDQFGLTNFKKHNNFCFKDIHSEFSLNTIFRLKQTVNHCRLSYKN